MTLLQRIKTPFTEDPAEEAVRSRPRLRTVGELLRERREELGLHLDEIGEVLRIKPSYLAALEQSLTHELPGPAYAIGFVRAYANHLGLDADKVLDRYRGESTALQTRPDLTLPVPLGERSLPGIAMLLVALILALCGYGTWYYLSTGERSRPERVASVPPSLRLPPVNPTSPSPAGGQTDTPPNIIGTPATGPVPGGTASSGAMATGLSPASSSDSVSALPPNLVASPAAAAAAAAAAATAPAASPPSPAAPAPAAGAAPTARSGDIKQAALPPPSATGTPAPGTPPAAQQPTAAESPAAAAGGVPANPPVNPNGRIAIKALADCWIQVRAPDQSIVFSRVLKSGEIYKVPSKPGLFLRTGNAGVLEISVDGKATPAIGAIGTLRRNVALDPEELIGGTAVHG